MHALYLYRVNMEKYPLIRVYYIYVLYVDPERARFHLRSATNGALRDVQKWREKQY